MYICKDFLYTTMANGYSSLATYITPTTSINRQLINTVLASKQQKFDANLETVNNTIQSFGNIDLIRDEDRQYLMNNLSKAIEIIDNTNNIDFSKSGVGSELTTYLSKAIDNNVLEQVANTKKIRKYQSTVQELKNKKPDLFAEQNDWYAKQQAGLSQYLAGQTNNLGNLEYTPYKDYNKDLDDNILKWAKEVGIQTFYEPGEVDGISFMMEGEKLSKYDVKRFVESKLDANARRQISIDNFYNYKDSDTTEISSLYRNYHNDNLDRVSNQKEAEIAKLKTFGASQSEIDQVSNYYDELKAFHQKQTNNTNIDRNSMLEYVGLESFLDTTASAYAKKDYTKVAPNGDDIRKAEYLLKRQKESGSTSLKSQTGTKSPFTTVPTTTNVTEDEREGLIPSAISQYNTDRNQTLSLLLSKDQNFAKRYNNISSEEEKQKAFEIELQKRSQITAGEETDLELVNQLAKYNASLKNLNLTNNKYTEAIESTADRLYTSMVEELNTENPDFNYQNFSKLFPNTVKLLTSKGNNLTNKERDLVRMELAEGMKDVRGVSSNAESSLDNYINNKYENVKELAGVEDPNAPSKRSILLDALGKRVSNDLSVIGSLWDEEVIKELQPSTEESTKQARENIIGALGESAESFVSATPIGLLARGLGNLFTTDRKISNLDEEDLQLKDQNGNFIEAESLVKNAFEQAEMEINKELGASERRMPQTFELVLDPVTSKNNPDIRREVANLFATKTNINPKNNDRLTLTIDKKDRSATIRNISEKEENLGVIQLKLEELDRSLLQRLETKESEWQFDVSNPNAVNQVINFSVFKDRDTSLKHLRNLTDNFRIPQVIEEASNVEAARKKYAPTFDEIFDGLYRINPNLKQEQLNELILTPYEVDFSSDRQRGVYKYDIKNKKTGQVVDTDYTNMTTFNPAIASARINEYITRYFLKATR